MSPEQLCAKGTESGHQKALFAWAAMARNYGFAIANDMASYRPQQAVHYRGALEPDPVEAVPELKWLHAIPNGGARDARTAALMKAEGIRAGVFDIFLPVARCGFHVMYVEMKEPKKGRESDEQREFGIFLAQQGYYGIVCRSWRSAAEHLQAYLTHNSARLLSAPAGAPQ